MLRFSDIVLGTGGEVACRRCQAVAAEAFRNANVVKRDIERVSRAWSGRPGPNLAFTGAEPFRHPAIAELFESAVAEGAERIRVDSDATALRSAEAADAALRQGLRHLRFTLLGSSHALHDALAGTSASFAETLEGVGVFARVAEESHLPVYVSARVPVCRHNLKDLPAVVDSASRAGASSVLLKVADGGLDPRAAAAWLEAACDTGVIHAAWVEVAGISDELATRWEMHLASADDRSAEVGDDA